MWLAFAELLVEPYDHGAILSLGYRVGDDVTVRRACEASPLHLVCDSGQERHSGLASRVFAPQTIWHGRPLGTRSRLGERSWFLPAAVSLQAILACRLAASGFARSSMKAG